MLTVGSSLAVTTVLLVRDNVRRSRWASSRAVDQPDHASAEAREVTYEEAHDLLTAFLKVPPLAAEKSGDGQRALPPMRSAGSKGSLRWELPVLCRRP
jgi:hypothetical protein